MEAKVTGMGKEEMYVCLFVCFLSVYPCCCGAGKGEICTLCLHACSELSSREEEAT